MAQDHFDKSVNSQGRKSKRSQNSNKDLGDPV